jgi:hypothetical protein
LFLYFKSLGETNNLPAFEDLESIARKLYRAYTSSRTQYRAMQDTGGQHEWSQIIPLGSPWTGPIQEESSIDVGITSTQKPRVTKTAEVLPQPKSRVL